MVSGFGAILFEELLRYAFYHFLNLPTGYVEPLRGTEAAVVATLGATRSWLFLGIPALGGLVSGVLVFFIAPEAEGHGTDAMIEAFHRRGGYIRKRVPLVKIWPRPLPSEAAVQPVKKVPSPRSGRVLGHFWPLF